MFGKLSARGEKAGHQTYYVWCSGFKQPPDTQCHWIRVGGNVTVCADVSAHHGQADFPADPPTSARRSSLSAIGLVQVWSGARVDWLQEWRAASSRGYTLAAIVDMRPQSGRKKRVSG